MDMKFAMARRLLWILSLVLAVGSVGIAAKYDIRGLELIMILLSALLFRFVSERGMLSVVSFILCVLMGRG